MTPNKLGENTASLSVTCPSHKHFRNPGSTVKSDSPNSIYLMSLMDYVVAVNLLLIIKGDNLNCKFIVIDQKTKQIQI